MADFVVLRGSSIIPASSSTLTLTEGTDFTLESGIASTAWFFRIVNSHHTGMGDTVGGGNQNLNGVSVYFTYSGDDVVLTRNTAATYPNRVDWEVVQYTGSSGGVNEFIVREKGDFSTTGGSNSVAIPGTVSSTSDLVPFICGQAGTDSTRNDYNSGTFTAEINGSNVDFVRGDSADTAQCSYAFVEFTGSNWTVQSVAFAESGTSGTASITTLADVNEAFIHDTHRIDDTATQGLDDMSRRVRITSTTQLTYDSQTATGATNKEHVVYIIENPDMVVDRYTGTMVGSGEEEVFDFTITTVSDTSLVSLTISNDSTGGGTAFPRGYINATLQDASTVRLRQSDNGQTSRYAVEVINWPEGGSATDALTADDVESASEVSSPSLGQVHALTATSVESASEISSPVLADVSSDPSDFVVIHGTSTIPTSASSVTIEDGVDFDLESGIASTAWFVRITNSQHGGQGNVSGGGSRSPNQIASRISYSGNDITFHRENAAAGADCRVSWQIVQYVGSAGGPNEFIVRSKTDATIGGGSTSTTVAVPGTVSNSSDVVPFISAQGSNGTGSGNHHYHATVTLNGSNFDVVRGGNTDSADYSLSLVEFTGSNWTVQAHEFVGSGTNSTTTFSTAVADVNETFIYTTFNYDSTGTHGVDDVSRRVSLDSTTQLRYESQTATGAADKNHTTYIVENPEMTVARYSGTMSGTGVEEVEDVTITSVVVGRTMTTLSNDTTGTATPFPNGYITHEVLNSTTVRLRQSRDDQTARYSFETIELPLTASADALTADDVESASEVTSPSIGQEHALTSTDVESASEVTSPAVGQVHALTATSVESASEVSSPTLGQGHLLIANDVESASALSSPSIGQVHSLSADDTESATEVSTPALGQEHRLLADDVEAGSEVSTPSLGQVHDLSADDVESASQVSTPGLSTEGTDGLSADSVESVSEVSSPALGQVHSLTADDVQSVTEVSAPTLAETQALFANDVESLSEVSSPALGQIHALLANDVESRAEVSAPGLDGEVSEDDTGGGGGRRKQIEEASVLEAEALFERIRKRPEEAEEQPATPEVAKTAEKTRDVSLQFIPLDLSEAEQEFEDDEEAIALLLLLS